MRLLSLDQSSHITGWAIFEDEKLVEYGKFNLIAEDIGERLWNYRQEIEKLIKKYNPDKVAFEDIQMQGQINNVVTYRILAEIIGVTQEYMVEIKMPYEIVSSNTWKSKLDIKGKQRAEQKKNAQKYILDKYGKQVTQDEADAICLGTSLFVQKEIHFSFE